MKTSFIDKTLILFFSLVFLIVSGFGQSVKNITTSAPLSKSKWTTDNPFQTDVFVENFGQFDTWTKSPEPIKYGVNNTDKIFFTQHGLTFTVEKFVVLSEEEREEIEKGEKKGPDNEERFFYVSMQWEGCNANPTLEVSEPSEGYYTFAEKGYENIQAKGYRKLVYKNLYNGIDVEYIVPKTCLPAGKEGGIKYSLFIHPGADISQVKMKYSGDFSKIEKDIKGNIIIETPAGPITDHAPLSYYENTKSGAGVEAVAVAFELKGNTISFKLPTPNLPTGQADSKLQTLIIDPWTTTPTDLTTNSIAYDIAFDDNENAYVSGGTTPFKISKYSKSGNYLWTFTIPYATWGSCAGQYSYTKFCIVQNTGMIFLGEGHDGTGLGQPHPGPRIMKINNSGSLLKTSPSGQYSLTQEMWTMFYNRCSGQFQGFGGGTFSSNNITQTDMNLTTSNVFSFNTHTNYCNDIASVVMDYNGDFYALMSTQSNANANNHILKSLVSSNYAPPCVLDINTGYNFQEMYNTGITGLTGNPITVCANALALNPKHLFSYDGRTLKAWDKTNGGLLGSVIVNPNDSGGYQRTHQGIAADSCGNIYVGGNRKVHVYIFNGSSFTPQADITTDITGEVYGVELDKLRNVLYVCGNGFATVTEVTKCYSSTIKLSNTIDPCLGNVTEYATGGVPPYTFTWSTGATGPSVTGLPNGTYYVVVSDASCIPLQQIDTIVIDHMLSIEISDTNSTCGQANGALYLNITNGTGPYSFHWNNSATTQNIVNVSAGAYSVTISDALGCTATANAAVTTTPLPATVSDVVDATCMIANGSAMVNVSGGTEPYSYLWNNGQTTQTIQNVIDGTYYVTVTDVLGCTGTKDAVIGNSPLPATVSDVVDASCMMANGSASVNVSGGTPPYVYSWNNGQTTQVIQNVMDGTYYVTVTDSYSCIATAMAVIGTSPLPISDTTVINATCGRNDGSGTVNVNSGTPPYTYSWNNGQTTQTLQNVTVGTYYVTITDSFGCTTIASVIIGNSPMPTPTTSVDSASCGQSDGSAIITVNGGTPPYSYYWSDGQTTQTMQNVPTGNYSVTATDSLGCITTASVFIPEGPGPTAITFVTNEICNHANGTAIVVAQGGAGTYTYTWSTNPQQTTDTATGLQAGVYLAIVNDGYCSTSATAVIDNIPGPTAGFYATPEVATIYEGPITLSDNSSGNNIRWLWDFGEGSSGDSGKVVQHDYQNVGTYYVTLSVTDINNCTDTITQPVRVKDIFTFYIPNSFSPNGDGINDFFFPQGTTVDPNNFVMDIFDRWGNLMFHTDVWLSQTSEAWNGTKFNRGTVNDIVIDVYVYRIKVKELEGIKHEYIGRIALVQ